MTQNQLKYMELMYTKDRDLYNYELGRGNLAETIRHNQSLEGETLRHNQETEAQARRELELGWFNGQSGRITALANQRNAESNARNAATNERNAATNEYNARVNAYNAESNRMNAYSNRMQAYASQASVEVQRYNAQTNRLQAEQAYELGLRNAATAEKNATTQRWMSDYQSRLTQAQAENYRSQSRLNEQRARESQLGMSLTEAQIANEQLRAGLIQRQTDQAYANAMSSMAQAGLTGQQAEMYGVNNALDKAFSFVNSSTSFIRGYGSLLGAKAAEMNSHANYINAIVDDGLYNPNYP